MSIERSRPAQRWFALVAAASEAARRAHAIVEIPAQTSKARQRKPRSVRAPLSATGPAQSWMREATSPGCGNCLCAFAKPKITIQNVTVGYRVQLQANSMRAYRATNF